MRTRASLAAALFLAATGCPKAEDAEARKEIAALRDARAGLERDLAALRRDAVALKEEMVALRRDLAEQRTRVDSIAEAAAAGPPGGKGPGAEPPEEPEPEPEPLSISPEPSPVAAEKLKPGLLAEFYGFTAAGWEAFEFDPATRIHSRVDPEVGFSWSDGPPDPKVPADEFAARWTGYVKIETPGEYVFSVVSDDGSKLFLDGELLVDDWACHGVEDHKGRATLQKGFVAIRLEYFENGGSATCRLIWRVPGSDKPAVVPKEALFHELPAGEGK